MWDKMEAFYHVAKAGSFTKAAKVLNKTQNALSVAVATLEGRLGHRLLHRRVNGVVPTRKGEEVFQSAQRILVELEGMKTSLDETKGVKGKIRINTTYGIANYVIDDHLIEFNKLYPDIVFEIICSDDLIDIIHNEVDIAITPEHQKSSLVSQHHLYTTQSRLYASQQYIDQFGAPKSPKDLNNHKLLSYPLSQEKPYLDVHWHLRNPTEEEKREPIFTSNSVESLFKAAQNGMGIVSSHPNMRILRESKLINVNPEIKGEKHEVVIVYLKRFEKNQKIQTFVNYLIEKFASQR